MDQHACESRGVAGAGAHIQYDGPTSSSGQGLVLWLVQGSQHRWWGVRLWKRLIVIRVGSGERREVWGRGEERR